ncbi:hypothetical protein GCM10011583_53090 [Streptomyces camponoticapitis]|uniref:Uncharacterized protein n=1 Tax=Streptomyces camponoticapitis TaxID=1616125 RepID=A0ABQ2EMI9_9ACTN|nr:hypothetical protein [Streptomyces camponoticapitis]GGK14497.1 hypothetical protein GCM10011583_53090 [Streptomyces camponoticapitis]
MKNTVQKQVKPSTTPEAIWDSWQSMKVGTVASTPVAELMRLLGVRLVEVEPGELASKGLKAWVDGRVGDAEIQIERTLPQAEREPLIRRVLYRLDLSQQTFSEEAGEPDRLRPALVGGHLIHIPCPAWCSLDHARSDEGALDEVYHHSGANDATLYAPSMEQEPRFYNSANIYSEPFVPEAARREAHIVVDDEVEELHMSPATAAEFAENMVVYAADILRLARRISKEQLPVERLHFAIDKAEEPASVEFNGWTPEKAASTLAFHMASVYMDRAIELSDDPEGTGRTLRRLANTDGSWTA